MRKGVKAPRKITHVAPISGPLIVNHKKVSGSGIGAASYSLLMH